MGRLEDIAERNRPNRRPRERLIVVFGFGGCLLVILVLMVVTNFGQGPTTPTPTPTASPEHRVHDVLLRTPRADAGVDAQH